MLTSLDISGNRLCGVWEEEDFYGRREKKGTYDSSGVTAIAEALKVNQTLTSVKYAAPRPFP